MSAETGADRNTGPSGAAADAHDEERRMVIEAIATHEGIPCPTSSATTSATFSARLASMRCGCSLLSCDSWRASGHPTAW